MRAGLTMGGFGRLAVGGFRETQPQLLPWRLQTIFEPTHVLPRRLVPGGQAGMRGGLTMGGFGLLAIGGLRETQLQLLPWRLQTIFEPRQFLPRRRVPRGHGGMRGGLTMGGFGLLAVGGLRETQPQLLPENLQTIVLFTQFLPLGRVPGGHGGIRGGLATTGGFAWPRAMHWMPPPRAGILREFLGQMQFRPTTRPPMQRIVIAGGGVFVDG